jgi:hypothetical protein
VSEIFRKRSPFEAEFRVRTAAASTYPFSPDETTFIMIILSWEFQIEVWVFEIPTIETPSMPFYITKGLRPEGDHFHGWNPNSGFQAQFLLIYQAS